jgi:hypothetical protein
MVRKFEYISFRFIKPQILSYSDYEIIKIRLTFNPHFKLSPTNDFFEDFKVHLIFLGVGVIGGLILFLDIADWLELVGVILVISAIFSLFSFVPSLLSYLGFVSDQAFYYSSLKKDILKSKDYTEFINLRSGR